MKTYLDLSLHSGWGQADANGASEAVKPPKQSFSLNFARPASKSKVPPAIPPKVATPPVQAPAEPSALIDSQISIQARTEPSGEAQHSNSALQLHQESEPAVADAVKGEEDEAKHLSAKPAAESSGHAPLTDTAADKLQRDLQSATLASADAVNVKESVNSQGASPASEEEGPPGEDGPPGGETL